MTKVVFLAFRAENNKIKLKNIQNTKSSTNLYMKYKTQYPSPTKPKIARKIKNNINKKRPTTDS